MNQKSFWLAGGKHNFHLRKANRNFRHLVSASPMGLSARLYYSDEKKLSIEMSAELQLLIKKFKKKFADKVTTFWCNSDEEKLSSEMSAELQLLTKK